MDEPDKDNEADKKDDVYEAIYKGWVPTVSGRLSFSILGDTTHPTPATTTNISDEDDRYIISYQKRHLLDAPIPLKTFLAPTIFGVEAKLWAACIGQGSNNPACKSEYLDGYLFLFHNKAVWRKAEPLLKKAQANLYEYSDQHLSGNLSGHIGQEIHDLVISLGSISSFTAQFRLERDGETTLSIPKLLYTSSNAPTFPANEGERTHMFHIVSSQLFFFLKDISHRHQHHDPHTDTVVDLYPFDGKDDYTWRCETLRSLYRKILEFKRLRLEKIYSSSLGILAYAKSFRALSDKKLKSCGPPEELVEPVIQDDLLAESIHASQDTLRNTTQSRIKKSESIRNRLIGVIAILIPLVSLIQMTPVSKLLPDPSSNLVYIGGFLVQYPLYFLAIVSLIMYGQLAGADIVDYSQWRWVRLLTRVVQPFNKYLAASLLFLLGVTLLVFIYIYVFEPNLSIVDIISSWIETTYSRLKNILAPSTP